eukprot:PhM_4_TR312/c0_g1_i1/m.64408/K02259/COX15; cytochrome c oxidase assembly protein subunit 15
MCTGASAGINHRMMRTWLYGCSGLIGGTVVIGGATRLTNSGLSIVEWRPVTGIIPPLTHTQWEDEFAKYKNYPEYLQNPIDLTHFKYIFFYEWAHRVFARGVGFVFIGPFLYYMARGHLNTTTKIALTSALVGYGAQGALGWYMVKSGMDEKLLQDRQKATVSAYRLTAHLTLAVALYSGLLAVALRIPVGLRNVARCDQALPGNLAVKRLTTASLGFVGMSLVSGAATAGLDAGLLYTDFPYMGEGILPPWQDVAVFEPAWRNLFENGTAAQLWHKTSATLSILSIGALSMAAPKAESFAVLRPVLRAVQGMVGVQALLGISTLMSQVYIPLALMHQCGALVLIYKLLKLRSRFMKNIM